LNLNQDSKYTFHHDDNGPSEKKEKGKKAEKS
jgi:hypothetical protein